MIKVVKRGVAVIYGRLRSARSEGTNDTMDVTIDGS
jgi:hypothetical protein